MYNRYTVSYFYSHAPYGTWLRQTVLLWSDMGFLLTRPLRDVTLYFFLDVSVQDFYSHAPYGTWLTTWCIGFIDFIISTHTPLTGRDMLSSALNSCPKIFLLTRPLRDVTPDEPKPDEPKPISTHTPLTGRDCFWGGRFSKRFHFYSHAPYLSLIHISEPTRP